MHFCGLWKVQFIWKYKYFYKNVNACYKQVTDTFGCLPLKELGTKLIHYIWCKIVSDAFLSLPYCHAKQKPQKMKTKDPKTKTPYIEKLKYSIISAHGTKQTLLKMLRCLCLFINLLINLLVSSSSCIFRICLTMTISAYSLYLILKYLTKASLANVLFDAKLVTFKLWNVMKSWSHHVLSAQKLWWSE